MDQREMKTCQAPKIMSPTVPPSPVMNIHELRCVSMAADLNSLENDYFLMYIYSMVSDIFP